MAHPTTITFESPPKYFIRPQYARVRCDEKVIYEASKSCYGPEYGTQLYRSASVHNAKDAFGWRKPSAYTYHKHRFQNSGGAGRFTEEDCASSYLTWDEPLGQFTPIWNWRPERLEFPPGFIIQQAGRTELRNKLLAKANRVEFDLGVALGEGRETYTMIRDAIKGIAEFFRDMRKGRFGIAAKRLLDVNPFAAWLQYRWGWLPTVYDVYDAANWWEKHLDGTYSKLRFYTHSKVERPLSNRRVSAPYYYAPEFESVTNGVWTMKGRYDWQVNDLNYVSAASCGMHNVLTIGWELLTLSHVLDWFISVGDFLEAWTRQGAFTYLGGTHTSVYEGMELGRWIDGNGYRIHVPQGPLENKMFSFQRWVETNPKPGLTVDPDTMLGLWSSDRIMDAVSLLAVTVFGNTSGKPRWYRG